MIEWAKKIKDFLDKYCSGRCDIKCANWRHNVCQHPMNPDNKNLAIYPERVSKRTAFRIKTGIPK
jgi:hypothetical protein